MGRGVQGADGGAIAAVPATQTTVLYLIRHGATAANIATSPRIQGQRSDLPLAPLGVRQAQAVRDFLADRPLTACYTSPLLRAVQTAETVARPHGHVPVPMEALTECNTGDWEGLDWQAVRSLDPDGHRLFHSDPAHFGYPGGESYADAQRRAAPGLDELLARHAGLSVVAVSHHVVLRTYLSGLLGLHPGQAREVVLDNGSISVVVRLLAKEGRLSGVPPSSSSCSLPRVAADQQAMATEVLGLAPTSRVRRPVHDWSPRSSQGRSLCGWEPHGASDQSDSGVCSLNLPAAVSRRTK